jgi:hypothetical protein
MSIPGQQPQATRVGGSAATPATAPRYHGSLSARYESGRAGSRAIGYDRVGGHSYGSYQIATNTGTMRRFMSFLQRDYSDIYQTLQSAGGEAAARTGSATFRQAWQQLAAGGRMLEAERAFIGATHYEPLARRAQRESGLDLAQRSQALREVVWSTAVQHGGGTDVVARALRRLGATSAEGISDQQLIAAIYEERNTRFGSSTDAVRQSVQRRFQDEQQRAQQSLVAELQNPDTPGQALATQGTQMAAADQAQIMGSGRTIQIMPDGRQPAPDTDVPNIQMSSQTGVGEVPLHRRLQNQIS